MHTEGQLGLVNGVQMIKRSIRLEEQLIEKDRGL